MRRLFAVLLLVPCSAFAWGNQGHRITAVFADGHEVVSAPSPAGRPRTTIVPPPISGAQAAGCNCANALGMTEAGQAVRGTGVNTATGAFSRLERDLSVQLSGWMLMEAAALLERST